MSKAAEEKSESEQFAEKLLKPDGFWRLLDDTVFQFNDLYRRFWRNGGDTLGRSGGKTGLKDAFVVPAMFDKQSRTFNWIALADPILDSCPDTVDLRANKITEILKGLSENFKNDIKKPSDLQWSSFERLFEDSPHCRLALLEVQKELSIFRKKGEETYRSELGDSDARLMRLNHSLSILYSSYSHPRKHSLEGCFFTALEKFGHQSPSLVGEPIFGPLQESMLDLQAWMNAREIAPADWRYHPWDGREQETIQLPRFPNINFSQDRIKLAKLVVDYFLTPLFMSWKLEFNGKNGSFQEFLKELEFLVLIPIYDTWIGSSGFGGLQAVLLVFLTPPCDGEEPSRLIGKKGWEVTYKTKVLPRCEILAQGLTAIAIRRAIATPIVAPYDLVRHFLKILAEVQDWDEAIVFRGETPAYSFKRNSDLPSEGLRRVRIPWELDSRFTASSIDGPREQSSGLVSQGNEFYMWWTCKAAPATDAARARYDLWSDYFLPELTAEERGVFQDTSIRFKFPKACRIPPSRDRASRDYLVEAYLRQQLELMRALIPKVRARRAALRNAVSAIMGRNMSHNIGSHVLARYAAGIAQHQPNPKFVDPRTDFLSYLQRRMDFLAEVATADQSFWTQPLAIRDQLERLNYRAQCDRFYGPETVLDDPNQYPPLLKFITGKDNLRANVDYATFPGCSHDAIDRLLFSCPGGEVGVHALYVILENVIRNSARHNGEAGDVVDIEVRVKDRSFQGDERDSSFPANKWEGLIEIHVLDYRSKLRSDGRPFASDKEIGEAWKWTDKLEAKKDEKGKRVRLDVIPDDVNCILQNEPILEEDGTPSPHYWGLREMQICAQYLRQLRLSDLEDVPYADHDAIAGKVPLIRAECAKYGEGADEYCLSYVFYVREAALLATIEKAPDEEATSFNPVHEAPGLAKLKLGKHDIERSVEPESGSVLGKALRELRNYAFTAHTNEVAGWVDRHLSDLPVRRLELPSNASSLTLKEAQQIFESSAGNPLAKMEEFHAAYAKSMHHDDAILAGIALGSGEAITKSFEGEEAIMPLDIRLEDDGGNEWADWWERASKGEDKDLLPLNACVWLDHPGDESFATIRKKALNNPATRIRIISYEACFSSSVASQAIQSLQPGQGWELIAASLPRVAVLDERVQSAANEPIRKNLTTKTCWEGMRVYVPERPKKPKSIAWETPEDAQEEALENGQVARADLDQPTFDDCRAFLSSLPQSMDFLVLHLTILERLSTATGMGIRECIHELIKGTKASDAQIVIVTGRGVPTFARSLENDKQRNTASDTKNHFRFLPVSALLEYLLLRPSKLGLMRVLWSASSPDRRPQ